MVVKNDVDVEDTILWEVWNESSKGVRKESNMMATLKDWVED